MNGQEGTLPASFGYKLSSLRVLVLGGGGGTLPQSISALSQLSTFAVIRLDTLPIHVITRFLSEQVDTAATLKIIKLFEIYQTGSLSFTGHLPEPLPASLTVLGVVGSRISGTIPSSFKNASLFVSIAGNINEAISGTLPTSWGSNGRFNTLALIGSKMSGTIPPFTNSTATRLLAKFNWTPMHGTIPANCSCSLSGTLPPLTGTPNLGMLALSRERLSGTLPSDLFALSRLGVVWLSGDRFSGTLPAVPSYPANSSTCASLGTVDVILDLLNVIGPVLLAPPNQTASVLWSKIATATATGRASTGHGTCWKGSGVGDIDLAGIGISGSLPSRLAELRRLGTLNMRDSKLSGTMPNVPDMPSLLHLYLFNTTISGELPHSMSGLSSLKSLMMGGARLSGSIPASFCSLTSLEFLDLSEAGLKGDMSSINSDHLLAIHFQQNQLSGTLPRLLSEVAGRKLASCLLFGNKISGTIPSAWEQTPEMEFFSLSNNR
eukprot:TRINITY_DN4096_c0_g1_i10.p1 TRINITY_DN4096_c0_g1~~TRINITY_DN4096_c0_g1_i10.p1  ORF type:complete len:492 (-),score=26.79 TRINITY_DN4096_c0_g1_i10:1265-2740(-)